MKYFILSAGLALALAAAAGAVEPAPPTVASLDRDVRELVAGLRAAQEQIAALEKNLAAVEKRLGDSYGRGSPFDTVERRLDDLEKDVKDLQRRR